MRPIVRITPDGLHVEDSDYSEELYSRSGRLDKYEWMVGRFGKQDQSSRPQNMATTASVACH